jgi:hypothetical protein
MYLQERTNQDTTQLSPGISLRSNINSSCPTKADLFRAVCLPSADSDVSLLFKKKKKEKEKRKKERKEGNRS